MFSIVIPDNVGKCPSRSSFSHKNVERQKAEVSNVRHYTSTTFHHRVSYTFEEGITYKIKVFLFVSSNPEVKLSDTLIYSLLRIVQGSGQSASLHAHVLK